MAEQSKKKVRFEYQGEPGHDVFVAGTFTDWKARRKLAPTHKQGVYAADLMLPPGTHEYKFVVDGQWRADPRCTNWVPDGLGSLNSVIRVE